ncbi:putative enoyl CoA hydratase [Rhizoclosmatium hyalinum]|nr:putative enoyl CoA hydratase [Rhizoclosmatium hyalinum]
MSTLPKYKTLVLSVPVEGVLHVEFNRPKKLNAMNPQMWKDLGDCFTTVSTNSNIRAIVLSGAGKGFTAGLDLMEYAGDFGNGGEGVDAARRAFGFLEVVKAMQGQVSAIEACRVPVIAAVHGPCYGAGIDVITAADVRFCSADAVFSVKEVDIALAADVGTLQRLPKVVGNQSWVHDVCLSARPFAAAEAKEFGLVSRVVEGSREQVVAAAVKYAQLIASKSPVAVSGTKNVLKYSRDHSVEDGLKYVGVWNAAMAQTEDMVKAAEEFLSKKKAVYAKL